MLFDGREKYFIVQFPRRPGLLQSSTLLCHPIHHPILYPVDHPILHPVDHAGVQQIVIIQLITIFTLLLGHADGDGDG